MSASLRVLDPSSPSYTIALEQAEHSVGIEALYDRCFGFGRFAKTAERLREGNQLLSDMSLVAVDANENVVAAVRLWPLQVGDAGRAVFVGPVAVDSLYRGSSLGLILTQQCVDLAKKAGWPMAILIGDEPYFSKIGFQQVSTQAYPAPGYIPEHRLLAIELEDNAILENQGQLSVPLVAK